MSKPAQGIGSDDSRAGMLQLSCRQIIRQMLVGDHFSRHRALSQQPGDFKGVRRRDPEYQGKGIKDISQYSLDRPGEADSQNLIQISAHPSQN